MPRAKAPPCPLSPMLQKQIKRLKGKLCAPTTPTEMTTFTGKVALPEALRWLYSVEWQPGAKYRAKRPKLDPTRIEIQFFGITESYGKQFADRPFASVLYDSGQFYWFTALDEDTADPLVYHVDHEGADGTVAGVPLSQVLAKYVVDKPEVVAIEIPDPVLAEDLKRRASGLGRASLARIDSIYLRGEVKDLTGIEHCTKLEIFYLEIPQRPLDPTPITKLNKLRVLDLRDVGDLAWLASLQSLRMLNIKSERFEVPFASLPKLENLQLEWKTEPPRLDSLGEGIKDLQLNGPHVVDAIAPVLPRLRALERLSLQGQPLDDLRLLAGLTRLNILSLKTNAYDAAPLASLVNVSVCRIEGPLRSLDFVSSLPKLATLGLYRTEIASLAALATRSISSVAIEGSFADLTPLAGAGSFSMYLRSDELTDVSPLAEKPIRTLAIYGKRFCDLTPLAQSPPRRSLDVTHTAVTDVSPLFASKMEELSLGPSFTDYEQLTRLSAVERVYIQVPVGSIPPETKKLPSGDAYFAAYRPLR